MGPSAALRILKLTIRRRDSISFPPFSFLTWLRTTSVLLSAVVYYHPHPSFVHPFRAYVIPCFVTPPPRSLFRPSHPPFFVPSVRRSVISLPSRTRHLSVISSPLVSLNPASVLLPIFLPSLLSETHSFLLYSLSSFFAPLLFLLCTLPSSCFHAFCLTVLPYFFHVSILSSPCSSPCHPYSLYACIASLVLPSSVIPPMCCRCVMSLFFSAFHQLLISCVPYSSFPSFLPASIHLFIRYVRTSVSSSRFTAVLSVRVALAAFDVV